MKSEQSRAKEHRVRLLPGAEEGLHEPCGCVFGSDPGCHDICDHKWFIDIEENQALLSIRGEKVLRMLRSKTAKKAVSAQSLPEKVVELKNRNTHTTLTRRIRGLRNKNNKISAAGR